jgi:8-oxo-dGTP pyrophosphatase MutT (NUDIX family)
MNSCRDFWNDLTEEMITKRLLQAYPLTNPWINSNGFRKAAVLIPLFCDQGEWQILFTRRTDRVQTHKGQVSFPGGGMEPWDDGPEETALRETFEEIGLPAVQVSILGKLADSPTISNFVITPVVGRITWPFEFILSPDEVGRVFTVPLWWLADEQNYELKPFVRINGHEEMVVQYHAYDNEIIWGVTGRLMVNLVQVLGESSN